MPNVVCYKVMGENIMGDGVGWGGVELRCRVATGDLPLED